MSRRIIRIILALLVVALISALFLLNPQQASVNLGGGQIYEAPMALVMIVTFVFGALFAFLLAFFSQFQLSVMNWRERRLRKLEKEHLRELALVRELVALEKYPEVDVRLTKILKENPDNAVARVLLATSLHAQGNRRAALKVLEEGRGRELVSAELYLKAAELQEEEGNITAALDNLGLLLQKDPNSRKVLREGSRLAEKLRDLPKAVEYQERLVRLAERTEYEEAQYRLAELEFANIQRLLPTEMSGALEQLLRKHREFSPAIGLKAKLAESGGDLEGATRNYLQAYTVSGDLKDLDSAANIWVSRENPERAVKVVRAGVKDRNSVEGQVFLAAFLISLGMLDEGSKELALVTEYFPTEDGKELGETRCLAALARAQLQHSKGHSGIAVESLCHQITELMKFRPSFLKQMEKSQTRARTENIRREQPAPQFSTP